MRKMIAIVSLLLAAGGCGGQGLGQGAKGDIQRSFFDRTIIYTLDQGAQEPMGRVEKILLVAKRSQESLSDEELLPLYRDADVNRDHHITAKEAQTFYREYILRFEESLGRSRVRPPAQPQAGQ